MKNEFDDELGPKLKAECIARRLEIYDKLVEVLKPYMDANEISSFDCTIVVGAIFTATNYVDMDNHHKLHPHDNKLLEILCVTATWKRIISFMQTSAALHIETIKEDGPRQTFEEIRKEFTKAMSEEVSDGDEPMANKH